MDRLMQEIEKLSYEELDELYKKIGKLKSKNIVLYIMLKIRNITKNGLKITEKSKENMQENGEKTTQKRKKNKTESIEKEKSKEVIINGIIRS